MTKEEQRYFDEKMTKACKIYIDEEFEDILEDFKISEHHEFSDKFYKNMDKIIKKESIKLKRKKQTLRIKVAVAMIIFVSVGIYTGTKNTEAFKIKFIDTIVNQHKDHSDKAFIIENFPYDLNVVPENWEYIYISKKIPLALNLDKMYFEDNKVIMYFKVSNKYIEFSQTNDINNVFTIDNFKYSESFSTKQFQGEYYEKKEKNIAIWTNKDYNFKIESNFTKDEIINIATNLKIISSK